MQYTPFHHLGYKFNTSLFREMVIHAMFLFDEERTKVTYHLCHYEAKKFHYQEKYRYYNYKRSTNSIVPSPGGSKFQKRPYWAT